MAHRLLASAFAIILFVAVFGLANIYVKALNRVKQPMSSVTHQPIRSSSRARQQTLRRRYRDRLRADHR